MNKGVQTLADRRSGGVLLVLAIFFAAIGILIGLGRLKAHEYRVTRRINRQYQLGKVLATRSALSLVEHECFPQGLKYVFPVYTNLVYQSPNASERLICDIIPTEAKDTQEMEPSDFDEVWRSFKTPGAEVGARYVGSEPYRTSELVFSVKGAESNKVYTCAVFKKTEDFWLNNMFGYIYRLDVQDGGVETGFEKVRLYLMGTKGEPSDVFLTSENYVSRLRDYPSIMMELGMEQGTNLARRALGILNGGDTKDPFYLESCLRGQAQAADSIKHGGGFLLSGTALVGFGESAVRDLYFSERFDLNRIIYTNDFQYSWIIVETTFATNRVGNISFTIDSFIMREPTTYTLSVYNSKLAQNPQIEPRVTTWVFQTTFPKPDEIPPVIGKQCILDTFGLEPTSLRWERRGDWPVAGIE